MNTKMPLHVRFVLAIICAGLFGAAAYQCYLTPHKNGDVTAVEFFWFMQSILWLIMEGGLLIYFFGGLE